MEKNNKTAERPNWTEVTNSHFERTGKREDKREHDLEWLAYRKGYMDGWHASLQSSDKDERIKELETRLDSIEFVLRNCRSYLEVYRSDWREGEQSLYAEICSCILRADSPLNL